MATRYTTILAIHARLEAYARNLDTLTIAVLAPLGFSDEPASWPDEAEAILTNLITTARKNAAHRIRAIVQGFRHTDTSAAGFANYSQITLNKLNFPVAVDVDVTRVQAQLNLLDPYARLQWPEDALEAALEQFLVSPWDVDEHIGPIKAALEVLSTISLDRRATLERANQLVSDLTSGEVQSGMVGGWAELRQLAIASYVGEDLPSIRVAGYEFKAMDLIQVSHQRRQVDETLCIQFAAYEG
ncbi:hypothetical protein LXA43DRAFT_1068383 [Ganoderma leucocontextum]|nr:hypothetical protein LXA43DRAFT_1068383 [Ganoderma leucocontextum]